MEKLDLYRSLIEKTLTQYCRWAANALPDGVQECVSFDRERDHYFWFSLGWHGKQRVFKIVVYLRIQDEKIWIEEDWTEAGIANDLLEAGISAENIVLGFQHPTKRGLTEFALA
uniref:XisI protein n=1 Tax=Cyanothece sp. (strain PCC 7425 / ATCC 29141) TaxID=395961 RepID=B8HTF2_CYAP4